MTDEIPPGWRATEYTRESGHRVQALVIDGSIRGWAAWTRTGSITGKWGHGFTSAAAAIAAIEKETK